MDTAESGQVEWRLVQERQYDCIMLDLKMPGMSGQQLFQTIRTFDEDLARRIVFITGDTISANTLSFVTSCGNSILGKPVDLGQVREFVQSSSEQ